MWFERSTEHICHIPNNGSLFCNIYSDNQSTELEKLLVKEFGADTDCTVSVEHQDGQFKVTGVSVEVNGGNNKIIEEIYAYLDGLKYINITVYAKSS